MKEISYNNNIKILAVTNVPVPYRVEFFNDINKFMPITVLYEQTPEEQTHRSTEWFSENKQQFEYLYLKDGRKHVKVGKVLYELKNRKYNIALIMGYTKRSEMISILWLRLHKKPYILSVDGGFPKAKENFIKKLGKRFYIAGATAYLSTGETTDEYLSYYGADKGRIYRIPFTSLREKDILTTPVPPETKKNLREELGINESSVIVSVGQLIHRKGFDVLLNSCKGLRKNIGIYIIGSNPTEEYIKIKEKEKLDNVHFVGFKKKEELKKYYSAADLFVLPTREDIWGLVINEAMAYGLPIITTDKCIAGLELVDSDNGAIVPAENSDALRDSILSIISDKDKLQSMSVESIKRIKNYTIEKMAKVHTSVFRKICEELL